MELESIEFLFGIIDNAEERIAQWKEDLLLPHLDESDQDYGQYMINKNQMLIDHARDFLINQHPQIPITKAMSYSEYTEAVKDFSAETT